MKQKTDVVGEDETWKSPEVIIDLTSINYRMMFVSMATNAMALNHDYGNKHSINCNGL